MNVLFKLLFYCWCLLCFGSLYAQVLLNEVCSKNDNVIADFEGDFPDWIELYNTGNESVALGDYYLSDDADDLLKWRFPSNAVINSQDYLLVFASGKDIVDELSGDLHCNFKISQNQNEQLFLSNEMGVVDSITLPFVEADFSYGRQIDGQISEQNNTENWVIFSEPSPNESNNSNTILSSIQTQILFSHSAGFYDDPFDLTLETGGENTEIRYTLDGHLPNQTSNLYSDPIAIDGTTVVRARVFKNGLAAQNVTSNSYLFEQTTLPVFSLITDPDNFFDWEEGIYVLGPNAEPEYPHWGANFWLDKEVPLHIEFFGKNKRNGRRTSINKYPDFEQNVTTKIHGGRSSRNQPMLSLRLLPQSSLGDAYMHHKFFDSKDISAFKRLVLRNSGSDFNKAHFRDAIIHKFLLKHTDIDLLAYEPVVVFLNGEYWGIHNIREKVDKYYLESNHQVDINAIDLLEANNVVIEGDAVHFDMMLDFFENNDLSLPNNYETAKSLLDVNSFCDYFIAETFFANIDWPNNNIKYWRSKNGGKWRYIMFDLDVSLNGSPFAPVDVDMLDLLLGRDIPLMRLFENLLVNTEFKNYFVNRHADLLNIVSRHSTWSSWSIFSRSIAEQERILAPEMQRHFDRWPSGNMTTWQEEIDSAKAFASERPDYVWQSLKDNLELGERLNFDFDIYPRNAGEMHLNTIDIANFPWKGYYFEDIPIDIDITPVDGYDFLYWVINETDTVTTPNFEMAFDSMNGYENEEHSLIAHFERSNNEKGANLTFFPNPVISGQNAVLSFFVYEYSYLRINILNTEGKIILNSNGNSRSPGFYEYQLDLDKLSRGVYFLELTTGNERSVIQFLVD